MAQAYRLCESLVPRTHTGYKPVLRNGTLNFTSDQLNALLLAAAAILVAAGSIAVWRRLHRKDPKEIERRRRLRLSQMGRIVEGHIVEIEEEGQMTADPLRVAPATTRGAPIPARAASLHYRIVFYRYSISGVTYETAQDVSGLEARFAMDALTAGQSISVKFDPANPSNSILMADDWSGLH